MDIEEKSVLKKYIANLTVLGRTMVEDAEQKITAWKCTLS